MFVFIQNYIPCSKAKDSERVMSSDSASFEVIASKFGFLIRDIGILNLSNTN
jgi:hypothetical protein